MDWVVVGLVANGSVRFHLDRGAVIFLKFVYRPLQHVCVGGVLLTRFLSPERNLLRTYYYFVAARGVTHFFYLWLFGIPKI